MTRINQTTTLDDVHQWISNYFNSTYTGTDNENYVTMTMRSTMKRSMTRTWTTTTTFCYYNKGNSGKCQNKGHQLPSYYSQQPRERKETIAKEKMEGQLHATLAESKDTHRHFATTTKATVENARTKAINNHPTTHNSLGKAIHNHHLINNNTTLNRRRRNIHLLHLNLARAATKAVGNIG
eukprot:4520911-Amphidinium_carterae.1